MRSNGLLVRGYIGAGSELHRWSLGKDVLWVLLVFDCKVGHCYKPPMWTGDSSGPAALLWFNVIGQSMYGSQSQVDS